jgi:dTDP-glucose pyrophosphorylase
MAMLADYCEDPVRLSDPKEINLTEVMNLAIEQGMDFKAVALQPDQDRVDCGSAAEYAAAKRLLWD